MDEKPADSARVQRFVMLRLGETTVIAGK